MLTAPATSSTPFKRPFAARSSSIRAIHAPFASAKACNERERNQLPASALQNSKKTNDRLENGLDASTHQDHLSLFSKENLDDPRRLSRATHDLTLDLERNDPTLALLRAGGSGRELDGEPSEGDLSLGIDCSEDGLVGRVERGGVDCDERDA